MSAGAKSARWSALKRERSSRTTWERTESTHYYVTALPSSSFRRIAKAIRAHWSIENELHWRLDVQFDVQSDEDKSRVRTEHAAESLAHVRHRALPPLDQDKKEKAGAKIARIFAAIGNGYLERILRHAA